MKLTNKKTAEVLMEFTENDLPVFYDELLGRELFDFGIPIPSGPLSKDFYNKKVVYPSNNKTDAIALKLFKKAFIEIYYNEDLMKRSNLEWCN